MAQQKLYTEKQVINALRLAHSHIKPLQYILDTLTHIELPSDEDVEEQSWGYREVTKDMDIPPNEDWSNGAKWMKDKILNK